MIVTEYLVITCGGTGGHFYPGLSTAREQVSRGKKVLLLLSGKNSEAQSKIAGKYNIPCIALPHMPSPSIRHPLNLLSFIKGLLAGKKQAKAIMKKNRPDAVLGMGSFASLPVIWAAKSLKIKVFLHDGNARIGKANRFLSRYAKALATAFPAVNADKVCCKCVVSGMPLRQELNQHKIFKDEAISALNGNFKSSLEKDFFTVLLFGGSQGARKLNEVFGKAVSRIAAQHGNIQLIHLTGKGEFEAMSKFHAEADYPLLLLPELAQMHWAYSAADLVISRSGGSSVAEINAFGKYSVLVPYPFAAELHQDDNADYLVSLGAAEKVDNNSLSDEKAMEILTRLCKQTNLQQKAQNAIQKSAWQGTENLLELIDN